MSTKVPRKQTKRYALLLWNPRSDQVQVLLDGDTYEQQHKFSDVTAYQIDLADPEIEETLITVALALIVRDRCDIDAVWREFGKIPEFQTVVTSFG